MSTIAELSNASLVLQRPGHYELKTVDRSNRESTPSATQVSLQVNSPVKTLQISLESPFVGAWTQSDSQFVRCVRSRQRPSWISRRVMQLFFNWNWVDRSN